MTAIPPPMNITSPTLHATILFTITVFVVILILSFIFQVEVVARGEGRVVPVGRVQVVQPEFSGQITAINVRNGDLVERGEVLIALNPTEAIADLGTIQAEQDRLKIETARIDALVGLLDLGTDGPLETQKALALYAVPEGLQAHPFTERQRRLLIAELTDLRASLDQITAREEANRRSEEVTNANVARVNDALDIQGERLQIAEQLVEQGSTSRTAFLDVQGAFTALERERDIYLRQLEQKIAERAALESERRRIATDLRRRLVDRHTEIDARLATLNEEERAAQRRVETATLTAPVAGIVDQLSVFTVGGVATAGAELLRIVPTDVQIEVEGTFSNQDIGFLTVSQPANIRLDAYPSERFGFVPGTVSDIAADSTENAEGQWGYVVRIAPEQSYLQAGTDRFTLRPGMTATIDVTTDSRRIISYFFAPIVKTIEDAMGER